MRMEKKECDTCANRGNGWGGEKCVECKDYDNYKPAIGGETMTFEQRGQQIGALVDSKQAQYGDAIQVSEEILRVLYPDGVPANKQGDMLLIVRIIDKLCRLTRGNGEGGEDAWADIAGYGLLGMRHREQVEAAEQTNTNESEQTLLDQLLKKRSE